MAQAFRPLSMPGEARLPPALEAQPLARRRGPYLRLPEHLGGDDSVRNASYRALLPLDAVNSRGLRYTDKVLRRYAFEALVTRAEAEMDELRRLGFTDKADQWGREIIKAIDDYQAEGQSRRDLYFVSISRPALRTSSRAVTRLGAVTSEPAEPKRQRTAAGRDAESATIICSDSDECASTGARSSSARHAESQRPRAAARRGAQADVIISDCSGATLHAVKAWCEIIAGSGLSEDLACEAVGKLASLPITTAVLKAIGVGKAVKALSKRLDVGEAARAMAASLVRKWREDFRAGRMADR